MGTTVETFHEVGKEPVLIDWLNIRESGWEIENAVDFSRNEVMPSGPGDVLVGSDEINLQTVSEEQNKSSGMFCERGGGEGKWEESLVKNAEKVLLSKLALLISVEKVELEDSRSGIDALFFRSDQT